MGGIKDNSWRMKVVVRAFSRLSRPASSSSTSRLGWSAGLRLRPEELHPPDRWRRFVRPCPPRPPHTPPEADAGPRINEPRGWIDPAP